MIQQPGDPQTEGMHGPPKGQRFPTQSHLPESVRESSIEMLNQTLADTTVLQMQFKSAHWNVRGPNFYQLHGLFEEVAEVLDHQMDDIAERATALGGQAMGTARIAASASRVPELPMRVSSGHEFVELLVDRMSVHDANLHDCIRHASEQNDLDTADLLNEVSREIAKHRWFLEAHLTEQPLHEQPSQREQAGQQSIGQQPPSGQPMGRSMEQQPTGQQRTGGVNEQRGGGPGVPNGQQFANPQY